MINFQNSFQIFNWFILSVKIHDTNQSFCCRFYFRFFALHPLQTQFLDNGRGDLLFIFGHRYWYLIAPFNLFKSMILIYPAVAGFIFDISPFLPPADPPQQRSRGSIMTSSYVSICSILFIQINYADLSLCCRFYFRYFALFTPLQTLLLNNG